MVGVCREERTELQQRVYIKTGIRKLGICGRLSLTHNLIKLRIAKVVNTQLPWLHLSKYVGLFSL